MPKQDELRHSSNVEDYLTAVYDLATPARGVGTTRIAQFMKLAAPSVSIMMRRLLDLGLIERHADGGFALTPQGERDALSVLRRHRLAERFLVDKLGFDWARAHVEAHRFEHSLSDEVTDALERFLGNPAICPHGHPIPDRELRVPDNGTTVLSSLHVGDCASVACVSDESASLLHWFTEVGLVPGAQVRVGAVDARGDGMLIELDGRSVPVGAEVASSVQVERITAS